MYGSDEFNNPLIGVIWKLQTVYNQGLLRASYAKQLREGFLQGHISNPHVVPKSDPRPISHFNVSSSSP
jgi:hypothetical protein